MKQMMYFILFIIFIHTYIKLQEDSYYSRVLLGKGIVGKTALIFRYINNLCPIEHDPTIEESYTIEIKTEKGEERQFKILDTSGMESNQNMIDEWICNANGFVLVFALNDKISFEYLKNLVEHIKKNKMGGLPMIVVGNKCDLQNEREVSKQEGEEFANSIGGNYIESSALTDENGNCKNIFQELANKIIKKANADEKGES